MNNQKLDQKIIRSLLGGEQSDSWDYCESCGAETDLATMNIATNECSACSKTTIEKMRELIGRVKDV